VERQRGGDQARGRRLALSTLCDLHTYREREHVRSERRNLKMTLRFSCWLLVELKSHHHLSCVGLIEQIGKHAQLHIKNSNKSNKSIMSAKIYHESYPPPWRPLLTLVFPLLPIFWKYRVTITDTTLTFGYSHASTTINLENIISASPISHIRGLRNWGGWGIRLNMTGERGYICKNGSAVKIAVKTKDKKGGKCKPKMYVFSCNETFRVCRILNGDKDWRAQ
jgi:hypothetical protein